MKKAVRKKKKIGRPRKKPERTDYEKLTPQQRAFIHCLQEMPDPNWTQAAKEAGYGNPYSAVQKLRNHPIVSKVLKEMITKRNKKSSVTAEKILEEIAAIAFLDPLDLFYEKNGTISVKSLSKLTPLQRKLIDKVEIRTDIKRTKGKNLKHQTVTVSSITSDVKLKALTLLAKHKGMLVDKKQEEHIHKVNWDDYYKARRDDIESNAKEQKDEQASADERARIEANRALKAYLEGPVDEDDDTIDAEYSVKELVDEPDEAA